MDRPWLKDEHLDVSATLSGLGYVECPWLDRARTNPQLRYVIGIPQSVILDDASSPGRFAQDHMSSTTTLGRCFVYHSLNKRG